MKRVLSFGGGIQTVAMLHLIAEGRIDRPDLVAFGDTQQEPEAVYESIERERQFCESIGLEFLTLTEGDLGDFKTNGSIHVPLRTAVQDSNTEGFYSRTCTDRFKISPIREEMQRRGWDKEGVELFLGMTTDEVQRLKPSRVKWIVNRWPLFELNLRRGDCEAYLERIGVKASKSACVFCPFRSRYGWQVVKANKKDWKKAVDYDESIRHQSDGALSFVHRDLKPLTEAVVDLAPTLFDNHNTLTEEECEGYCGA